MTDDPSRTLSPRLLERIAEDFAPADREAVTRLLAAVDDDAVRHAVLTVAEGRLEEARIQVNLAYIDPRDVLWNAQRHRSR